MGVPTARSESGIEAQGVGAVCGAGVAVGVLWVFLDIWDGEASLQVSIHGCLLTEIVHLVELGLLARLHRDMEAMARERRVRDFEVVSACAVVVLGAADSGDQY